MSPCLECGNVGENWVCLSCSEVFCSRYVKGHMVAHFKSVNHPVCMSFSDLSFWWYVGTTTAPARKFPY